MLLNAVFSLVKVRKGASRIAHGTHGECPPCGHCDSQNVYGITRIVGYFSRINNWNKSKLGELRDRHRGNYSVSKVATPV